MPPVDASKPAPTYPWWNIAAGVIFGVAAMIVAPLVHLGISSDLANTKGQPTWLTLFVGGFLVGCLFWWLLMSWPRRFSLWRGAVTGILVACASYPAIVWLADTFQRDPASIVTFPQRWSSVLLSTTLTLMTTGFAVIPAMAVVGIGATWALVRFHPGTAALTAEAQRPRSGAAPVVQRLGAVLAICLAVFLMGSFAWLTLTPIDTAGLAFAPSQSHPAKSYDEAITMFRTVQAEEADLPLHRLCPSTLLTHGSSVARVAIFFHGLTSCPAQGAALAERLYAAGYNVYMPRMFGHGESDPNTLALKDLTAEKLVDMANRSVDMAQGLGDEVVVVGLSAGGTIASWVAQYRADVRTAVPVSPFFGPQIVPAWATHATIKLTLMLPDMMLAWNPLETVAPAETDYAYPRPSTHTLAQVMRLGALVAAGAEVNPPAIHNIRVVLNEADIAVNNALTNAVIASWREHGHDVEVNVLPFSGRLPHDVINPREPGADIEAVYPLVIEMIGR